MRQGYYADKPHFLDSCSLCRKALGQNSDIYMYSQECRQEQIDVDEANQKRWKISSKRSNTVKDSSKESDTNKAVRTGTVAVAVAVA
ncbi:hypothetical protein ACS0TY_003477 [Phlomoides rotata]